MGTVAVVVPFRGGCPHRERALRWVLRSLPYRVHVVDAPAGPWVKAVPVWQGLRSTDADVVVVHDADVFAPGLAESVRAVHDGAPYAFPHRDVHRLSEDGTARLMAGEEPDGLPLDQLPYTGIEGGGVTVARRDVLLSTPLDPRFVNWGQEDQSFGMALLALHGPAHRLNGPLFHLFHPHPVRMDRKRGSDPSWALFRRYCKARSQRGAMEALVGEAIDALNSSEPSGDHSP